MKTTFFGTQAMNKGAATITALALILSFVPAFQSAQAVIPTTTIFLTSGTSWTVPANWDSSNNTIEVIGSGGNGATHSDGGGGGGGGGYSSKSNVTLTPGGSVTYKVGISSDSYLCNSTSNCSSIAGSAVQVGAKAGTNASGKTAGTGGTTSTAVGTTKRAGGNGYQGDGPNGQSHKGGGGGGAAGKNAAGNSATDSNGGQADGTFGGAGGAFSAANNGNPGGNGTEYDSTHGSGGGGGGTAGNNKNGGAGGFYGGSGGGARGSSGIGGAGAQGLIIIIYTPAPTTGNLTITKNTIGGDGTFNFTLNATSTAPSITTSNNTGSVTVSGLTPGSYTVTEPPPGSEWDQTGNPGTDCVNVVVTAGNTATCTITNTKRGSITVFKDVVAPNGTTNVSDSHVFSVTLDGSNQKNISEGNSKTYSSLVPGTHTLAEIGDPDFDLLRITVGGADDPTPQDGAAVTVVAGQDTTVTITNGQHQGTLHVIKHVINLLGLEGFDKVASDFSINVTGTANISPSSFLGAESPGTTITMDPGTYSVTEPDTLGYAMSLSGDCTGVVMPSGGGNKTCTVTNSDFPLNMAALTIIKDISNFDNGGTAGAGDFTLRVNGAQVDNGAANILTPETYTVSEDPMTGYELDHIACFEGSTPVGDGGTLELVAGHAYTCTVFNNDLPGTLHVVKTLINDNGGTAVASDFSFSVNQGASVAFNDNGQNDITVNAGDYSVTETATSTYTTSYDNGDEGDCSNIHINNGGSATCTITNTFHPEPRDVTAPVSTFGDNRNHQIIDTEIVQLSLVSQSTDNVGPTEDPKSGVASAKMELFKLADAATMDGEGFFTRPTEGLSPFESLSCSNPQQVPIEIVALNLTSAEPFSVSWGPQMAPLDRGVYCAVVHATDKAVPANVEHTAVAGPFAYTFTPAPTPTPSPSGGGGGGGGGSCAPGFVWNPATISCNPVGQVLGASTGPAGQVLGVSCGLYMDQHLKKGSAKNKPDQVTKLQQFLNKYGYGTFPITGFFGPQTQAAVNRFQTQYTDDVLKPWALNRPTSLVYLTTLRRINLLSCPELSIPLPALVPWNANPNAQ